MVLHSFDTLDGRNPAQPGTYPKPCKSLDKVPTSTGERRISEPSTVCVVSLP